MDLMEITEKERLSGEDAAARQHTPADALAQHNKVEFDHDGPLHGPRCLRAHSKLEIEPNGSTALRAVTLP